MKYDFKTAISRKNTGAMKWDEMSTSTGEKPDVVPLSVADMEFRTCPEIVEGIKASAESGVFGYTRFPPAYKECVVEWMKTRHNWDICPDWIEQTWGVVLAIYNAVKVFTNEGDGVIIQTPVYYPFFGAVKDNNRRLIENPLKIVNGRYEMDYDDLREKVKDAKLLILCSPHNPVGRVWTPEELRKLAEICLENNVIVVSDEIHFDIVMKPHVHTVYASLDKKIADNCIVCTAPSKTFNLAGLHMSNIIISNPELREKFREACKKSATSFYTYFGYAACESGYRKGKEWVDEMLEVIQDNYNVFKEFMAENFPKVTVYDLEGTYLAWFDCRSFGMTDKEMEKFLTDDAWLFLDQGYLFGAQCSGFERINLACPQSVLLGALERLKAAAIKKGII